MFLLKKLADAPNARCRAVTLGALLDASGDVKYEAALIELLDDVDLSVREKAFDYLVRTSQSRAALIAFKQQLLNEDNAALRARIADEVICRAGVVRRGHVHRRFVEWSDRLAVPDRTARAHALEHLDAAYPLA